MRTRRTWPCVLFVCTKWHFRASWLVFACSTCSCHVLWIVHCAVPEASEFDSSFLVPVKTSQPVPNLHPVLVPVPWVDFRNLWMTPRGGRHGSGSATERQARWTAWRRNPYIERSPVRLNKPQDVSSTPWPTFANPQQSKETERSPKEPMFVVPADAACGFVFSVDCVPESCVCNRQGGFLICHARLIQRESNGACCHCTAWICPLDCARWCVWGIEFV